MERAAVQLGAILIALIAGSNAAASPQLAQCRDQPLFGPSGTARFEGVRYPSLAALKPRLIAYGKQHPGCVMTRFTFEPGTSGAAFIPAFALIQQTGMLGAASHVGFLIEPRNTP